MGGGTLISHTYLSRSLFWGSEFLNFHIFGGFKFKNEYFWGYENSVDIFGIITKLD